MNTLQVPIQPAIVLAQLLERLDVGSQPFDAHQYHAVATKLAELLSDDSVAWQSLLQRSDAAAYFTKTCITLK